MYKAAIQNQGLLRIAKFVDPVYQGLYRGKSHHPADLDNVLKRSQEVGVEKVSFKKNI